MADIICFPFLFCKVLNNMRVTLIFVTLAFLLSMTGICPSSYGQQFSMSPQPVRVACVGNSVTYGVGVEGRDSMAYPAQLQKKLGNGYLVGNFGLSGASLLKKGFKPYYKSETYLAALRFDPQIVVIHLGLNDTDPRTWPDYRDEFVGDYLSLIDTFRINGAKEIFIARLSPIFNGHKRFKAGTRDWYWQIQDAIEEVARVSGVTLIDFNTPLKNRPDLLPDNLHPTAAGARLLTDEVYSAITGNYGGLSLPWGWSDNMVLQREKPLMIRGTANRGDTITIDFAGQTRRTNTSVTGHWQITLDPLKAGGPFSILVRSSDGSKLSYNNILIGEVWFCSGQSNMVFPVLNSTGAAEAISSCNDDGLRLLNFTTKSLPVNEPWDSATLKRINELDFFNKATWTISSEASVKDFSGVAYYFGKYLRKELGVPVGLIEMAVGGSPAEAWIERKTLEMHTRLVDILYSYRTNDMIMQWCRDVVAADLLLTDNPNQRHPFSPAYLYESGISQIAGFPIRGFLWYQGESNVHFPELYEVLFPALVKNWRNAWGDTNLPFYYAQLSGYKSPSWPTFRDSQRRLQDMIPHSAMIVTYDAGNPTDIHPKNKKIVGERFAILAMGDTYAKKGICRSPEPIEAKYKNGVLEITFSNTKNLGTSDGDPIKELEIKGADGLYKPVNAQIKRNTIIIDEQGVKSVRYAWHPFSFGNLVNEVSLPASTFKIDVITKE
jgi:sialate O-acetylesterase